MKAMILAAGFGTRLWPLTEDRTKPAIPFLGRPLIAYAVDYLAAHGIRDLIVNLHHQPESVRGALGDGSDFGVSINYSFEEEILGTSGALDKVRDQLMDGDFVVINGKIVTDIDLGAVIRYHRENDALATLVLRENRARERFSIVEIDDAQRITRFAGFPDPGDESGDAPLMFTGIQVLSPRIFEYVPRNRFSHSTTDVYPKAMAEGQPVLGYVAEGEWFEMSTLDRYVEASIRFMRWQGKQYIAGRDCRIEAGASVEDAILWDGVIVEAGASVRQSVLGDGVRVAAGEKIERAVVVRREIVREIERGTIDGDRLIVPF